ncbi:MAG: hypothetical protein LAT84_07810 [Balneolia bacterium]|nr:hypothetical protein [Balneolia bacterium]
MMFRTKTTLILVFVTVLMLVGCRKKPMENIERDYVSFTKPQGWLLQDITDKNDNFDTVLLRKQGMFSSGFVTITSINEELEPESWLRSHSDMMAGQEVFTFTDETFSFTGASEYAGFPAESAEFTQIYFGAEYEGVMFAFTHSGYSVLVLEAGTIADREINKAGFSVVSESLRINEAR